MARGGKKKKTPPLNLVSLMDVFTILVFFLLVNSANTEELSSPKILKLPDSVAERKPAQTVVVLVTTEEVLIRGQVVGTIADADDKEVIIESVTNVLKEELARAIGLKPEDEGKSREVTIMGDRTVPFKTLKKVMSSCTAAGYNKISLAVLQKATQSN
ncbi:MAG: biopolymer transporter ExbD [Gammaproteobacteria bacterium]|nr:biopolymer transporter ExbD [Gammaproteobacteria bacterium]